VRALTVAVALVAVGMGIFEVAMRPDPGERLGALFLFAFMAAGIAVAARLLPSLARRVPSLRVTVVGLGASTLAILAIALVVAGRQMFISTHDLNLLWVIMGFGVVASLAFGLTVSGPLTEDLERISSTSSAIANGRLGARTGVQRLDEAGRLAHDVDLMAGALEDAEASRRRDEHARRVLFAAVGHDLRTPLASMRAAIEALQDGLAVEPDRYLDSLAADVDALSSLVDDVYLLARLESGDIVLAEESVDLNEIVDEAFEVFRPIASKLGIRLRLEAESRVSALASSEAVARVVRNLIDNAIRHSPTGGEVVVEVTDGAMAGCTVSDEGAGFPPGFVVDAFARFTRDDTSRERNAGGAGLGLAIARSYMSALGGEIWADPGPGGRVSFRLPAGDGQHTVGTAYLGSSTGG
jgi:signal transduction histidine kinase